LLLNFPPEFYNPANFFLPHPLFTQKELSPRIAGPIAVLLFVTAEYDIGIYYNI